MLYPIHFALPSGKIIKSTPTKVKVLSNIIPGEIGLSNYTYNTEESYYQEYRESMFAITHKKNGWDCMRHYEILANGCIPIFRDIDKIPNSIMTSFPKSLVKEGNLLFLDFEGKQFKDLTPYDIERYNILNKKLLDYTRVFLTTEKLASYILSTSNNNNVSKVLILNDSTTEDYLADLIIHGFKNLLGTNCHEFPKKEYLYPNYKPGYNKLYGKGFTYTNTLQTTLRDDFMDNDIDTHIRSKHYDLIIYPNWHRCLEYYDKIINKLYDPSKVIFICGEDYNDHEWCTYHLYKDRHPTYVRELRSEWVDTKLTNKNTHERTWFPQK